jgi:hypothetical protein
MLHYKYSLLELLFSNHIETMLCPEAVIKIYRNPFILSKETEVLE